MSSAKASRVGKVVRFLIGVFALLTLGAWMIGPQADKIAPGIKTSAPGGSSQEAEVAPVEWVSTDLIAEAIGTVKAKHKTIIASKLLARVEKVLVRAGDHVREGETLIELDNVDLEAKKGAAIAELQAARADSELRKRQYERVGRILEQGASSQRDYELAKANYDASLAKEAQAREQIKVVESLLEYTKIQAPTDGVIIERAVEPGDLATPGKELLSMYDPQELRLEAIVSESLLPYVSVGKQMNLEIETPGLRVSGVVEEVVPQAAAATRSFTIKVSIPHLKNVYPGMFGRLEIPYGTRKRLLIPAEAVRRVGQVEMVELADKNGDVIRRQITTGERYGEKVEVLSGINPPGNAEEAPKVLLRR